MKFEINEVYTIKVPSGEEYVAKVVASDELTVTVTKPATLVPTHDGGMQLTPALLTADHDKDVVMNKSCIVLATITKSTTAEGYRTAISGIATPSKSIILG